MAHPSQLSLATNSILPMQAVAAESREGGDSAELEHANGDGQQVSLPPGGETDLGYRLEMAECLAARNEARHLLLYDEVAESVPETHRSAVHSLPGYERALLPGLLLAPGFDDGATVLVTAPPNPVERRYIQEFKRELEVTTGQVIGYRIAYRHDDRIVDLLGFDEDEYSELCRQYATTVSVVPTQAADQAKPKDLLDTVLDFPDTFFGQAGKTLIMPFQTSADHYRRLALFTEQGRVALPSIPNLDKVYNTFVLAEGDVETLAVVPVAADGTVIEDLEAYQATMFKPQLQKGKDTVAQLASGIVAGIDRLQSRGLPAMAKLDANSLSGLGNLSRQRYPEIYDSSLDRLTRVDLIADILGEMEGGYLPRTAIIEEFITMEEHEGVPLDYTVGGLLVGGKFYPTSIVPFGTEDGSYRELWIAPSAEALGETSEDWQALWDIYQKRATIMAQRDYTDGILAGDVFIEKGTGNLRVHDYNDRRGGRSVGEALVALRPEAWYEGQVEVDLSTWGIEAANEDIFDAYTAVCESLYKEGALPFSTAFGYYGSEGNQSRMKFKIMIPVEKFRQPDGTIAPRSEQLKILSGIVYKHTLKAFGKEIQSVADTKVFTPEGVWAPYHTGEIIADKIMPQYAADIEGQVIVDVGTASGLLAIKAAQLGASRVMAADLNPLAAPAVSANALLNGFDGRTIEPVLSDGLDGIPEYYRGRVGVIIANPPTQPFLLSDITADMAIRDSNARAWNEADGNGRGVLDKILTSGTEVLRPGGKIITATTTRHGHGATVAMLNSMQSQGKVTSWREIHRQQQPLAEMYEEYRLIWQGLQEADGDPRIYQIDNTWYHDFIVLEIVK